jgi:hypothetical protein
MPRRRSMAKLSERRVKVTIGIMRSMAGHIPISPFHLNAADEMEQLLEEVLKYRKKKPLWVGLTPKERIAYNNYADRLVIDEIEQLLRRKNE